MLKKVICLLFIEWTLGKLTDLEFQERGQKYKEKIMIDKKRNIIIYSIPNHGQLQETQILHDFNFRLRAWLSFQEKKCFITAIPKSVPTPTELEEGLEKINHTFPTSKFMVEHETMIEKRLSDTSKLSAEIIAFCGVYSIVDMEVLPMEEIKRRFAAQFKGVGRRRRSTIVLDSFRSCASAATMMKDYYRELEKCGWRDKLLVPVCRFKISNCIYVVTCRRNGERTNCVNEKGHHILSSICCEMKCVDPPSTGSRTGPLTVLAKTL